MCCSSVVCGGAGSLCIEGRARSPFSHGCGGWSVAQPPRAMVSTSMTRVARIVASWLTGRGTSVCRDQRSDLALELCLALVLESVLDVGHAALGVDEERIRHRLHAVRGRHLPLGVV